MLDYISALIPVAFPVLLFFGILAIIGLVTTIIGGIILKAVFDRYFDY